MPSGCQPFLTRRFELALQFASGLHYSQCRKGTPVPYISHLMAVSALVLEAGGDEDVAIAALLHFGCRSFPIWRRAARLSDRTSSPNSASSTRTSR